MKKVLILLLVASQVSVFGQEVADTEGFADSSQATLPSSWSLEQCIEHARLHNLQLKLRQNSTQVQQNRYSQTKSNFLPSLSASVGESANFGRSIDPWTNTFQTREIYSTNFGIGAGVNVFNAFRDVNSMEQSEMELRAAEMDERKTLNDISLNIATMYLQILFQKELVRVASTQLELTITRIKDMQASVQAGTQPAGELSLLQAQRAQESNRLINAQNTYKLRMLDLRQMLDLPQEHAFEIVFPEFPEIDANTAVPPFQSIYDYAVLNMPEVKSSEYRVQSSKKALEIAYAGHHPTINMNAGFSTGFSSANERLSFGDQLSQNSINVGVSLNIPIFNRFAVVNQVKNSKVQITSSELNLHQTKLNLYKQIQKAYLDASASLDSYRSRKESLDANQESFRYVEEKFKLGVSNAPAYNQAKTNLTRIESDLLQAKYQFIFQLKILDFYAGKPLSL